MKKQTSPLLIILIAILVVFLLSRLIAFLTITEKILPMSIFLTIGNFRLHHFVYGNILILITSFIAIGLRAKVNSNWLALFYGIGLGLVLDEFPLWMGNVQQLNSYVVWIPYAPIIVVSVCLFVLILLLTRKK